MDDLVALLPAIRLASATGEYGRVLKLVRKARGLTQAQFGARCGYSAATISRFETGARPLIDVAIMRLFGRELGVPITYFGLVPSLPADRIARPVYPGVTNVDTLQTSSDGDEDENVRRRDLLAGMTGLTGIAILAATSEKDPVTTPLEALLVAAPGAAPPVPIAELRTSLRVAWGGFTACKYREPAERLPVLIETAVASRDNASGQTRDQISALIASAYVLACELAIKSGQDGMAWVTADRALHEARESGDPHAITAASQAVGIAMRRLGHFGSATSLLTSTALALDADRGDPSPSVLASYGSLLCAASYAAAQHGDRLQAVELIEEAERTALRSGKDPRTAGHRMFDATNVAAYRISIHNALGEPGIALDYLEKVNPRRLRTPERRARLHIDTARSWAASGRPVRAYEALRAAEQHAPEEIRRPSVSALISTLRYSPGAIPEGLQLMAKRAGAPS